MKKQSPTEKQMRATYKRVFGREYDDSRRRQAPLPIHIAYEVAMQQLKKKGEA